MTANVLEIEGLTKRFGDFVAVGGVDLAIRRGSIHALIGPNGAGKTTCFNLLTKFLTPTSGTIRFDGRDITRSGPASIARMGLVRSFQISAVFNAMTALENVMLALQRKRGESYDFWTRRSVLARNRGEAAEHLDSVGIAHLADLPAGALSYGHRRALEIATTLALDPAVILLDEPTAGMGAEDVGRITRLIHDAARGRTVVMVEHNLGIVSEICDDVTVLSRGQILARGDYASVAVDERVVEAYLGGGHA
ncbi:ABC transporter ATP-binding protein [Salinarimonas ramus]|uniref:ABC transporter ATP-binding protein n=1 Tax=Salinarimonas ramus TaxID=690164 RepID=A0A917V2A3_9HYPH|nr:ABC transporter ATP-binding protein [Salinarimonas ramus]GGK20952.1 ABC transporter ATP-binding protein [Salinarimonas ramus]